MLTLAKRKICRAAHYKPKSETKQKMPVEKPTPNSAPVFYPKSDYPIVKYLDLTRFVSLLQQKALFFCRLDKLEDQFEGVTSKSNFQKRVEYYRYLRDEMNYFTVPFPDEKILEEVKKNYEFEKKRKKLNCVNCWNKSDDESVALWKIYSDFSKGIMIKSSISLLEKSLMNAEEEIILSEICYLDYDKEAMPDGNIMFPLIHKQRAYNYEDEVRLIHEVKSEVGFNYDWTKKEVQEGIYIKTDLNILIEEIVIGPYSPKWFFKLVENITNKYGLFKTISKSKLSLTDL